MRSFVLAAFAGGVCALVVVLGARRAITAMAPPAGLPLTLQTESVREPLGTLEAAARVDALEQRLARVEAELAAARAREKAMFVECHKTMGAVASQ